MLRGADWQFFNEAEGANTANDVFIEKYKGIFDTCFPFKNVKGKELTKITKPWISSGLLKSIKKSYINNTYVPAQVTN